MMIKLQDNKIVYDDIEYDLSNADIIDDMFVFTAWDGTHCIPVENATDSELECINAWKLLYPDGKTIVQDLDTVKESRISILCTACNEDILGGFDSTAFDGTTSKHYDSAITDQMDINGLAVVAMARLNNLTTESIKWKATGETECYEWTPQQMIQLALDMKSHTQTNIDKYNTLRTQVNNATTVADVELIVW